MINVNKREMFSLSEIREETSAFRKKEGKGTGNIAVYFDSMQAMLKGAYLFVSLFGEWHNQGLVYGSSDPSRFCFDLSNGGLYFNGTDLLKKEGGKFDADDAVINEFLAPELVAGLKGPGRGLNSFRETNGQTGTGNRADSAEELSDHRKEEPAVQGQEETAPEEAEACWNLETDWYFMSVFLFEYFFHTGSPFEGKDMVNHCFLSPLEEESYRAEKGVFCMEPGDHGNQPVRGVQDRLIRYWEEYPDRLRKVFQRAFLSGGSIASFRPTELDWKQILVELMMDYQTCSCGFRGFSDKLRQREDGILLCPGCGRIYYPLSDGLNRILLSEGGELFECQTGLNAFDYETVTGRIVENKRKKGLFGIRNLSDGFWRGFYPDGTTREIHKGQVIPIWEGMTLAFERGENWTLRVAGTGTRQEASFDTMDSLEDIEAVVFKESGSLPAEDAGESLQQVSEMNDTEMNDADSDYVES